MLSNTFHSAPTVYVHHMLVWSLQVTLSAFLYVQLCHKFHLNLKSIFTQVLTCCLMHKTHLDHTECVCRLLFLYVKQLNPQSTVEHYPWFPAAGRVEASPVTEEPWDRNKGNQAFINLYVCCLLVLFITRHCYTCRIHEDVWVPTSVRLRYHEETCSAAVLQSKLEFITPAWHTSDWVSGCCELLRWTWSILTFVCFLLFDPAGFLCW